MKLLGSFNQSSQCSQHVITGSRPPHPQCEDSDPEHNVVLHTEELEAHIEAFLEEVEEDMEMDDMPLLENVSPLPIPAPVVPGFAPFTVSTSQHCVPLKSLLRKVWHPYQDSLGQCCCEPGGWCNDLPCTGWVRCVPRKIQGCSSLDGGSQSRCSCCGTDEEPCNQQGTLCSGHTPTHAPCPGSPVF